MVYYVYAQVVPTESDKITLGLTLPGDSEVINIDSGEKEAIGNCYSDSPYTLFILVRHYA